MNSEKIYQSTEKYWNEFYSNHDLRHDPSAFSLWVLDRYLIKPCKIFELGCGNGRDSFLFAEAGHTIVAIDGSKEAINENQNYKSYEQKKIPPNFLHIDFRNFDQPNIHELLKEVDVIYSRFVLHAIPADLEEMIAFTMSKFCRPGTRIFHEYRTQNDPLMQFGEVLSGSERVTDHYRRFINPADQISMLVSMGWELIESVESNGLAVFGVEDPVVARVVFRKL